MDRKRGSDAVHIARRLMSLAPALAIAADVWAPSPASGAPASRPTAATTAIVSGTVTLAGNLHPKARPELDVGRMDPAVRLSGMSLLFRMSPRQKALQERELAAVKDPVSPRYHQWLTPEQYAAQFGASPADIARAATWLTSRGLSVHGPSRTATRIGFSGTIAQVEQAFHTEMHRYRVDGEDHFAMSVAPSVPTDLAESVVGLRGLHDFRAKAAWRREQPQYALPITEPDGGPGTYISLSPADFARIYDVNALYAAHITGAGQTIAVAEQSDFNDADIAAFRTTFGLPTRPPLRVLVPNTGSASVNDNLEEAELNIEWAGAVAPDATVEAVFTGDAPNSDALDALMYAIEQRTAPVMSTSFGRCEAWFTPADASFLSGYAEMAALEGVTVLVASGDTGAAGCDSQSAQVAQYGKAVIFPASVPNFLAVGGTQFQITSGNQSTYLDPQLNALSYIPEAAWNETLEDIDAGYGGLGASGGGASRLFAKPYWQVPHTPSDGLRDLPDIALSASADTLPYAVSMSWTAADGDAQAPQPQALTAFGGTSVAAPALAGILALLNQAVLEATPGSVVGLGDVNATLYALANSPAARAAFHDITAGDNIVPCEAGSPDCPASASSQFGFAAGPGYDQATGLGSIDAANLVAAWQALTPTSTTLRVAQSGTMEGSSLELTASIASKTGSIPLTGSVAFYFLSAGDGGPGVSGTLGASPVTSATSMGSGTASLVTSAPGGLSGAGTKIFAFYGGDAHYLASSSASSSVSGTSTLAVCPTAVTLATGQAGFAFKTTGGNPPVQWSLHDDETCTHGGGLPVCSAIDGGAFTAGPKAGSVTVVAIDKDEAYVTAIVTVVGDLADGGSPSILDALCPSEAVEVEGGSAADSDAPVVVADAEADARAQDGSAEAVHGSSAKSGCACSTVRVDSRGVVGGRTCGVLLALAAARAFFSRLRRNPGWRLRNSNRCWRSPNSPRSHIGKRC
jgi:Pro-kumamolisin, activation domain/Subtilase family